MVSQSNLIFESAPVLGLYSIVKSFNFFFFDRSHPVVLQYLPKYRIPYCGTTHVIYMYWNVCLMMVTVTETCSKFYIIECIVFWLNDILVNLSLLSERGKESTSSGLLVWSLHRTSCCGFQPVNVVTRNNARYTQWDTLLLLLSTQRSGTSGVGVKMCKLHYPVNGPG
jgi:hypothetical protein